jgi:hypothetical protein
MARAVYVKSAGFDEGEGNKPGTWRWPTYVAPQGTAPAAPGPQAPPSFGKSHDFVPKPAETAPGDDEDEEPPFSDEDSQR